MRIVTTEREEVESATEQERGHGIRPAKTSLFVAAVLAFATANALSFFVRNDYPWQRLTGDIHGLLITRQRLDLGVPWSVEFWPRFGIVEPRRLWSLAANVVLALAVSISFAVVFGASGARLSQRSKIAPDGRRQAVGRSPIQLRFSLKQMIVLTTLVAVLLGAFVRAADRELRAIKFLYLAGPCIATWCYFAMQRRRRLASAVGLASALAMAALAAFVGQRQLGDFTFALFGVFACWTPQFAAFAVAALMAQAVQRAQAEPPAKSN